MMAFGSACQTKGQNPVILGNKAVDRGFQVGVRLNVQRGWHTRQEQTLSRTMALNRWIKTPDPTVRAR